MRALASLLFPIHPEGYKFIGVFAALTLLRNLVAPQPHTSDRNERDAGSSLDALVKALSDELVLDTVADLCSASSKRENRHWGLVLVEVLAPLLAQRGETCPHVPSIKNNNK